MQGANIIKYSLNQNTGVITFDGSNLTIKANANENAIINLRGDNNLVYGSNLADMITIESGSGNTIYGLDGNDTLIMDSENNSLIGGNGNDSIYINATTNKLINSGDDNDTIYVNATVDMYYILCYPTIGLSFMHSPLCSKILFWCKARSNHLRNYIWNTKKDIKNLEWIFGVFFCCKNLESKQREQIQKKG